MKIGVRWLNSIFFLVGVFLLAPNESIGTELPLPTGNFINFNSNFTLVSIDYSVDEGGEIKGHLNPFSAIKGGKGLLGSGGELAQFQSSPPMEWGLLTLMWFSGGILATVSRFLITSLLEIVILAPNPDQRDLHLILSSVMVLGGVPWIVSGSLYGLSFLSNNYRSSFWWMLLGAYSGQAVSFGLNLLFLSIDRTPTKSIAFFLGLLTDGVLVATGTVLFYALFRKPFGQVVHIGGLINYTDGKFKPGLPTITPYTDGRGTGVNISIIRGRF